MQLKKVVVIIVSNLRKKLIFQLQSYKVMFPVQVYLFLSFSSFYFKDLHFWHFFFFFF